MDFHIFSSLFYWLRPDYVSFLPLVDLSTFIVTFICDLATASPFSFQFCRWW